MLSDNNTPFEAIGFEQFHRDDREFVVIAARGRFEIAENGSLSVSNTQGIVLTDEFDGDPLQSPLLRTSDVVPFKPATDVTVLADAYPPDEAGQANQWYVGVRIGDHKRILRVSGPREWHPKAAKTGQTWGLTSAKPCDHIALTYSLASGGLIHGNEDGKGDIRNPIGPGLLDIKQSPLGCAFPAPQIDSEEHPISNDPSNRPEPQGFGPVPPWWDWRLKFGGTYDDEWTENRHPMLPGDFDYRFHQVAHPNMIFAPYLAADEEILTQGFVPGGGQLGFRLPNRNLFAVFTWENETERSVLLNLDGVHIDLRAAPRTVDLTWRAWCPKDISSSEFFKVDLFETKPENIKPGLYYRSVESGLTEA